MTEATLIIDPDTNEVRAVGGNRSLILQPKYGVPYGMLRRPDDLVFDFETYFPNPLVRDASGSIGILGLSELDYVPAAVRAGSNQYWCQATGSDGDGSFATPWLGIDKALATATYPCTINVLPGFYQQQDSWNTSTPGGACWVRKYGFGKVVSAICWATAITISSDTGTTYKATRSNVTAVVDRTNRDYFGNPRVYAYVATKEECRAQPGTWSNDGGNTTVYVNRVDGAAVTTTNTTVYLSGVSNGKTPTSTDMLVSGIEFEGGSAGAFRASLNATGKPAFMDCKFKYAGSTASAQDGLQVQEIELATMIRCEFSYNAKDGLNITPAGSPTVYPYAVAIDCWGHHNGWNPSTSNNGATAHNGAKMLLIRGVYERNFGGNIAIIDSGTHAWCVGTVSRDSYGDVVYGGDYPPTNWQALSSSKLFLTACRGGGSTREMAANSPALIRYTGHTFEGAGTLTGSGIEQG